MTFTLIGYPTQVFQLTWEGDYFGILCVKGIWTDAQGKQFKTMARKADVIMSETG